MMRQTNPAVPSGWLSCARLKSWLGEFMADPVTLCLLLAAGTLALYWPATGFDFVNYDDPPYVVNNAHIRSGLTAEGISWALSTGYMGYWLPLIWLSYMSDVTLFGMSAGGFHFTNLLLHAANAVLVFLVFRKLSGAHWRSALVGAAFAFHPLQVESVAWVTERKDVLSTFLGLLTLWCYVRYARLPDTGSKEQKTSAFILRLAPGTSVSYWLALLCFALALMSKPMMVTVPFLMLLLDYWPLRRFESPSPANRFSTIRRLLAEKAPFFALSAIFSVLTLLLQRHVGHLTSLADLSFADRLGNAVISYLRYLGRVFWPVNLAVFYPHPSHWPGETVALAATLLIVLCGIVIWVRRRFPYVFTGWFWFTGMLVPAIGLVQSGDQAMADRFTYMPLIGIFVIVSWATAAACAHWRVPKTLLTVAAALLLVACALRAKDQLGYWQNGGTLFRRAVAVTRNNYPAHYNLGIFLMNKGRAAEAASNYRAAIRIRPDAAEPHMNLGLALEDLGQLEEAAKEYREAVRIDPNRAGAHFNLGCVLASLGRREEAIEQFTQTLRLKPDFKVAEIRLQQLNASSSP